MMLNKLIVMNVFAFLVLNDGEVRVTVMTILYKNSFIFRFVL